MEDDVLLLKTPFGKLTLIGGFCDEVPRMIDFEENALTISGLNILSIFYGQADSQIDLPPSTVRDFETYLLEAEHSFQKVDVKWIVNKFQLNKKYSDFSITFFVFVDEKTSKARWFSVSSWDTSSFVLEISTGSSTATDQWKIPAGEDVLIEALERACRVAQEMHAGTVAQYIKKLDLKFGLFQ